MSRRIGTLAEKSLHAALKAHYAHPGDHLEREIAGYVIDIVRAAPHDPALVTGAIEIQTRALGAMKTKLTALLDSVPIRVVHPIAQERHVVRVNADGVVTSRRKSPLRGTAYHAFGELVGLTGLLLHPNLTVEIALIHEEQWWIEDGRGSWRRKRWSIHDRRLIDVFGTVTLAAPADYAALLPAALPPTFDTAELAAAIRQPRPLAQKMAYTLREIGLLSVAGKRGNAILYARTAQPAAAPT
ncbi:MAG: hypothetical protein SF162_09875 [bacterium]|nr:hypothetical protein [bacterium]